MEWSRGAIEVAGPALVASLTDAGLIDEYRFYIHPVVLGRGKSHFFGTVRRLRFVGSEWRGRGSAGLCAGLKPGAEVNGYRNVRTMKSSG